MLTATAKEAKSNNIWMRRWLLSINRNQMDELYKETTSSIAK